MQSGLERRQPSALPEGLAHLLGSVLPAGILQRVATVLEIGMRQPWPPGIFQYMGPLWISRPSETLEDNRTSDGPCLIRVPDTCTVSRLIDSQLSSEPPHVEISSNYSILKAVAATAQIVYSSLELYHARGRQIARFGYAAYSLTVIPYILMSLLNLLATICEPQYPTMFLVLYRGETIPTEGQETRTADSGQQEHAPSISVDNIQQAPGMTVQEELQQLEAKISGAVGVASGVISEVETLYDQILSGSLTMPDMLFAMIDKLNSEVAMVADVVSEARR